MEKEMMSQTLQDTEQIISCSLNNMETDTIGEILNISMGSAATAVSTLLGRKVNITTPTVSIVNAGELRLENLEPAIGIEIQYIEGLSGNNLLVMKQSDIKAIVSLLIQDMDDADEDELNELHISAVSEIMNQMMGASSTALSSFLGKDINISTPSPFDIDIKLKELKNDQVKVVSVSFMLEVEDLINSEFVTIMPIEFTKELVKSALNFDYLEEQTSPHNEDIRQEPEPVKSEDSTPENYSINKKSSEINKSAPVSVKPVKLQSFDNVILEDEDDSSQDDNFNLILGVPLDVTVELGRAKMKVKNILDLRQGSIIELDRLAGDPVDVIVNGQLIAKGDVVIIDDNFGIRITEILSNNEISKKIN